MMKKILFCALICLCATLEAKLINKIVVLVNNEPITQVDIAQTMQRQQLSQNEALDTLIKEKIITHTCKKYNIQASPEEINDQLMFIANKNNLRTIDELALAIKQDGGDIQSLKDKITYEIGKQKLFGAIASGVKRPNSNEIAAYKKSHPNDSDDDIANTIYNQKAQEQIKNFIEKEQLRANIKILDK